MRDVTRYPFKEGLVAVGCWCFMPVVLATQEAVISQGK
jgi:hypothetical protein